MRSCKFKFIIKLKQFDCYKNMDVGNTKLYQYLKIQLLEFLHLVIINYL